MLPYPSTRPRANAFKALFDFEFRTFITTDVMRLLYIASIALYGIALLGFIISGLKRASDEPPNAFLVVLALAPLPIAAFFGLVFIRVFFELILVWFRIAEALIEREGGS